MTLIKNPDKLRSLVPQSARELLYAWHPGRARRWRRYPGLQRVGAEGHAVVTFDDGPDEDATPAVLEALDRAGIRATFFLLASQVDAHSELAHDIVRRGHEIGLHGYEHERHDRVTAARSRDDVVRGFTAIEDAIGIRCCWYRPPYGKMSDAACDACRLLGMRVVYWSAWGLDWEDVLAARIVEVASTQIDDGAILLLHDSARYGRRPTAIPTAHAILPIAQQARERGISLVALGDAVPVGEEEAA